MVNLAAEWSDWVLAVVSLGGGWLVWRVQVPELFAQEFEQHGIYFMQVRDLLQSLTFSFLHGQRLPRKGPASGQHGHFAYSSMSSVSSLCVPSLPFAWAEMCSYLDMSGSAVAAKGAPRKPRAKRVLRLGTRDQRCQALQRIAALLKIAAAPPGLAGPKWPARTTAQVPGRDFTCPDPGLAAHPPSPLHLFGVPPRTSHAEFLDPNLTVPPVQARTQARFMRSSMHYPNLSCVLSTTAQLQRIARVTVPCCGQPCL